MPPGDSYDYNSSILEAWEPMILGAVDSEARCCGLVPIEPGNYWYYQPTECWIDRFGIVTGLEGEKNDEGSVHGFDPQASWLNWSTRIPKVWADWESQLPDPADFEPLRQAVYQAMSQLALDPKSKEYHLDSSHAASEFASARDVLTGEIGGMDGAAMIAFNHEIASRVDYTTKAQAAACCVAAYAVQAEQAVWKTARANLAKTVSDAVTAFQGAYPGGHGGGDLGWLSMVSAISGALALIPTPAAPVLGTISGATGSIVTFSDYLDGDVKPSPLGADSPAAVCSKLEQALADLNTSIVKGEDAVASGCRSAQGKVHGQPEEYDLSSNAKPALLDEDDPRAFLELNVEYAKLNDIANVTLPAIATGFDVAHHFLDGALNAAPFERSGAIGQNPYSSYSSFVGELQALLHSSSWKISASAQHMRWVVKDFQRTDDWVAQAHRDLTKDTKAVGSGPGW